MMYVRSTESDLEHKVCVILSSRLEILIKTQACSVLRNKDAIVHLYVQCTTQACIPCSIFTL